MHFVVISHFIPFVNGLILIKYGTNNMLNNIPKQILVNTSNITKVHQILLLIQVIIILNKHFKTVQIMVQ